MEILLCMLRRSKTWPTLDFGYDDCTLPSGPHSKDLGGTMTGKHKIWGLGCWGRWGHLQDNCTILKNTYPIVEDYSEMFSSGWLYRNVHLRFCNIHMLLMPRYVYCLSKSGNSKHWQQNKMFGQRSELIVAASPCTITRKQISHVPPITSCSGPKENKCPGWLGKGQGAQSNATFGRSLIRPFWGTPRKLYKAPLK